MDAMYNDSLRKSRKLTKQERDLKLITEETCRCKQDNGILEKKVSYLEMQLGRLETRNREHAAFSGYVHGTSEIRYDLLNEPNTSTLRIPSKGECTERLKIDTHGKHSGNNEPEAKVIRNFLNEGGNHKI